MSEFIILLFVLFIIGFIQNMAFTFSSRSRNSGDPAHHAKAALLSNGIWFACHILIWSQIWNTLTANDGWNAQTIIKLSIVGIVYVVSTTMGSVYQMKRMLKSEEGKRRVGAR